MPPRYAYWTILVDNQPTAFRAATQEDLLPTFKRLQEKHASATMMWFQNGKLWASRVDAQEAMRARGEMGRKRDPRQPGFRERQKLEWRPKADSSTPNLRRERPEWKPKPQRSEGEARGPRRSAMREGGPAAGKLEWKPKGSKGDAAGSRRSFKPEGGPSTKRLEWKPRDADGRPSTRDRRPDRKPVTRSGSGRDKNWRPGGEHRDPRQKYKDAKKAKWQRFKKQIRTRWEAKTKKKRDDES